LSVRAWRLGRKRGVRKGLENLSAGARPKRAAYQRLPYGHYSAMGTDGACMTSGACQNPSLTYMAITARAADYAVSELKKGNL